MVSRVTSGAAKQWIPSVVCLTGVASFSLYFYRQQQQLQTSLSELSQKQDYFNTGTPKDLNHALFTHISTNSDINIYRKHYYMY